jgi:hypothetical protein
LKRVTRITLVVLSYVVVMAIGGVAGLWYGFESGRDLRRFALEAGFEERFNAQLMSERMLGDLASYRNSLREYLSQLKARRGKNGLIQTDHVIAVDTVVTEARLAMLAEQRKDTVESARYFAQAASDCPADWSRGCPPDRLRELVVMLDHTPASGK